MGFNRRLKTSLACAIPCFLLLLASVVHPVVAAQGSGGIQWITEEFAPYNYTGDDGIPAGIAVGVLEAIWERLGLADQPSDIQVLPWARGYRIAQEQPGTCLFSTTVTDPRRDLFHFVEPLVAVKIAIIAPRARGYRFESIEDLAPFDIGVVRDDIGDHLLQLADSQSNLIRTDSWRILLRMLQGGRFDLIAYNIDTARWNMQRLSMDPDAYEPVFLLQEGVMGYACHPKTDPELIARLQDALDALIADGTVERITRRYLEP